MNADELREKVARLLCEADKSDPDFMDLGATPAWESYKPEARAAIATVIEACAEVADRHYPKVNESSQDAHQFAYGKAAVNIAKQIRALSPKAE